MLCHFSDLGCLKWRFVDKQYPIMEDGAFKPNTTMLGSLSDNSSLDFSLMDELLLDGFWLETTEQSNFWQPTGRPSSSLDNHSFYSHTSDINNLGHFRSELNQLSNSTATCEELGKHSNLAQTRSPYNSQLMDHPPDAAGQSQNQEPSPHPTSPAQSQGFVVEGNETNRRLWIGPNRNMTSNSNSLVRSRLVQAIEYLKESTRDKDVLIQIWVPINRGGKNVLTTKNQPFSLNSNHKSLALYRHVSKNYQFAIEEGSKEFVGLPGRVFLKRLPEWTPDVRFFKREEYPRINHAQQYNIGGSIALPVFERGSGTCLGVVEIISTSQIVSHRPELEHVCKALEAVDLKSSDILVPPGVKDCSESYQVALAEIKDVLKCVCDMHKLPLAQTWAPCSQQGKGGCRHSDENYAHCVSTIDYACYVRDPQVWDFHVACSEHHLLKGEGVAGGAFTTNQPCFATDITAFSKEEYPLSHHAKMFRLCGAVAIRLRCVYSGSADFVLEFFLPLDCRDAEDQKQMLHSLSSVIQQICRSLRVVTDQEFKEETTPRPPVVKRTAPLVNKFEKGKSAAALTSPSKKSSQQTSWIAMASMVDEGKGKGIAFALDNHKKEPEEEFKLTTFWENNATELPHASAACSEHQQSSGLKESASGSSDYSILGEHHLSGTRRAGERRRTKTEKTISLQVLRQYFSGSLKDAAKSIGVCPTTLKRICRQHGITRWPSRKIKKVGHSLKKLQLVIDSVQGAEGSIQLSSFYNNFPEFGSTNLASPSQFPTSNPSDNSQKLNSQPENSILSPPITASKSPSSSGSHTSSSSFCCSVGAIQSDFPVNPSTEPCMGTLKRAWSDAELQNMVQEETKLLVRSKSHKIFTEDVTLEALPPLPKVSSQTVQDGSTITYKVKATLGEENVRFSIQPNWHFAYLLQEVKRRFGIDDATRIDLKYLDDDSEWVLLTCDADLEECIDIHKSTRSRTIKLSLHWPHHQSLPNCPS